jgi:hypothetical protein
MKVRDRPWKSQTAWRLKLFGDQRFGAHRMRMSFQPLRAAAAAWTMLATSAVSTGSSEIRAVPAYCYARARRSKVFFPHSMTRAYASHEYANVSRFRYSMSSNHSFLRVDTTPLRYLIEIDLAHILESVFGTVYIPE